MDPESRCRVCHRDATIPGAGGIVIHCRRRCETARYCYGCCDRFPAMVARSIEAWTKCRIPPP